MIFLERSYVTIGIVWYISLLCAELFQNCDHQMAVKRVRTLSGSAQ